MRFVIDANVVISASLSKQSIPFRALESVLDHHTLLISEKTFEELKTTLYRFKFDKYFTPVDTRPDILATILKYSIVVIPTIQISICRDTKDNMYLELAVSGKADAIITGDPDLLVLHPYDRIPILNSKQFLDHFNLIK